MFKACTKENKRRVEKNSSSKPFPTIFGGKKSSSFYSEGIAQSNSFIQEDCNFSLLKGQQAISVI